MEPLSRQTIQQLSIRDYCLYRAICMELDELHQAILYDGSVNLDLDSLATEIRDRRLLIGWLRELHYPAAAAYTESGPSEAEEDELLRDHFDE